MTTYASINFRTKKAFKEAVKRGEPITIRVLGPMGIQILYHGDDCVSGPWAPEPHKWYASVKVRDGKITHIL